MISKAKIFDHGVAWEKGNSVTQGYCVNGAIYISGQFSHDQNGFIDGDIGAQTRLTLENLDRVLKGFEVTKSNLAYMEIYLINPQKHFDPFVQVFKEYLEGHRPAATLIGVTYLASPQQLVEISAVAHAD
jgi:2-iminobutanoate/2-iminopropanoate deaminase